MIKRIVKMTFQGDKVAEFLAIFENSKDKIRNVEGCLHLELLQHKEMENVLFTFSWWKDEAALHSYRHSDLFKSTWSKTKVLFATPAEAWTVAEIA